MDIQFALGAFLLSRTPITNVVGTDGVYVTKAPQKRLPPFILYERSGGNPYYHSGGASNLAEATLTITCRAETDVKAAELYELIRNEVDGGQGTWSGVAIRSAFLSAPVNGSVPDGSGGDAGHPSLKGSLVINYTQAVPTLLGMP